MKPTRIDKDSDIQKMQLKKALVLAEKCLTDISKTSFKMLKGSDIQDLDIYNGVYKINQYAHEALKPIHRYCLDEHSTSDS